MYLSTNLGFCLLSGSEAGKIFRFICPAVFETLCLVINYYWSFFNSSVNLFFAVFAIKQLNKFRILLWTTKSIIYLTG